MKPCIVNKRRSGIRIYFDSTIICKNFYAKNVVENIIQNVKSKMSY